MSANDLRDEAELTIGGRGYLLRPTFAALLAAEDELGPLFALVERAGKGELRLAEMTALFWHCLADPADLDRDAVSASVVELGLARCALPLRILLGSILKGSR